MAKQVIVTCVVMGSNNGPTMSVHVPAAKPEFAYVSTEAADTAAIVTYPHARRSDTGRRCVGLQPLTKSTPLTCGGCEAEADVPTDGRSLMWLAGASAAGFRGVQHYKAGGLQK